jgi:hypothetical protein
MAVLVPPGISIISVTHFVQDHLYNPVILPDTNILAARVGEAEGKVPPETGIHISRTDKHSPSAKRGAAHQCPRKINWELNPFHRWHQGTGSPRQDEIRCSTKIIRGRLLAFPAVGFYHESGLAGYCVKTTGKFGGRKDHLSIFFAENT